ncbi:MAG: hydrogenase maturation nickel metallochaperone HypA [Nanoarchaeota archaeon]|nr:hydrogenase maturation nickel metallochaperone HypA [Nanoarchaeota archaeon]MBU1321270.1 hydrogenase maturation nickel metallochaperone HypA [Nanoarchaeota archaeon]MBU1597100.1 hydrogenase maturation nickel metallochaperone HypA [Nanoarchaeota archaeon]MBU2442157.1 hydrogenase maturation nickel metallochaperone HypA [Nanoarchaeota archaeon]
MHETIIVKNILEEISKKAQGKKITSITIEVGDLAHLSAEELKEFMSNMVDYDIIVNNVKALVECVCGYKGEPKILMHSHDLTLFECPKCQLTPKVLKGEDIVLREIKTQ